MNRPRILAVGHACLDIVHMVPKIPMTDKVASERVTIQIGGNAANAAVAICDLGATADLCTVMGNENHPFTRVLMALLVQKRVGTGSCRFEYDLPCPNSTIMVLPDGERAVVNWQSDEIRSAIADPRDLSRYQMVIADSYRLPMVRHVFSRARELGIPTMLDVDGVIDDVGMLPPADHIWFSQKAWRKQRIKLQDLRVRFGGVVGVTDGDRPVSWIGHDGVIRYHAPPTTDAKNTLGAGDVFRSRLALGLCLGERIEDAISGACISACEHITEKPLTRMIP
jgi:sugar/nucleoside kinase (ribokinase family)